MDNDCRPSIAQGNHSARGCAPPRSAGGLTWSLVLLGAAVPAGPAGRGAIWPVADLWPRRHHVRSQRALLHMIFSCSAGTTRQRQWLATRDERE